MTMAMLPTATRCPKCGARMRWVYSSRGGRIPIDAEPHPDGRGVLVLAEANGMEQWVLETRRPYRAIALREQGSELYRIHICPAGYSP